MATSPPITKYIDPLTDFGFKRLFGNEPNKDLLIDFLNSIFQGRKNIVDLEYNKNEHTAEILHEGSAVFDLTCTAANGERFIIEMQRGTQSHFKKRAIYYTSLLATSLAPKGSRAGWRYDLPEIYFIAVLENFSVGDRRDNIPVRDICLMDRNTGKVFYEGLGYIFLELANFVKDEVELETDLDKWLFVLQNMSRMDKLPLFTRKPVFEKLFRIAEYVKLTREEKDMYNTALKHKWDAQDKLESAWEGGKNEGRLEGRLEGKLEGKLEGQLEGQRTEKMKIALELKHMGMQLTDIARITELSVDEIAGL